MTNLKGSTHIKKEPTGVLNGSKLCGKNQQIIKMTRASFNSPEEKKKVKKMPAQKKANADPTNSTVFCQFPVNDR